MHTAHLLYPLNCVSTSCYLFSVPDRARVIFFLYTVKSPLPSLSCVRPSTPRCCSHELVRLVRRQFCVALFQVAKKSADLRQYVEAWDREMAAVNTYVDLSKNLPDKSSSSSSSSSDDESVDGTPTRLASAKAATPRKRRGESVFSLHRMWVLVGVRVFVYRCRC